jgi:hypothetical protein
MKREYTPPQIAELDPADVPADAMRQLEEQKQQRDERPEPEEPPPADEQQP